MSVKENRSSRHTKEWILSTACTLFNEHGTQAVSTKRSAKEMSISPGNLGGLPLSQKGFSNCIFE
ncbi:MAG: TetR/AcrR family transcriptional regulator [bacterium]|nr:TetR/AcrR family transcriptional regulator [bacterium]